MRRRERYRGLVWLRSLPDDPAEGRLCTRVTHLGTMAQAMEWLLTVGLRRVELQQEQDYYTVQVYPRPGVRSPGVPAVALSYVGSNLRSVLWQAVDDLTNLANQFDAAQLQDREAVRWVS